MLSLLLAVAVVFNTAADSGNAKVAGTVRSSDGVPIEGAVAFICDSRPQGGNSQVHASSRSDFAKRATSDKGGHFSIMPVDPRSRFDVLVSAAGCRSSLLRDVAPSDSADEVRLEREDPRGQRISGRVTDAAGKALADATVAPYGATTRARRILGFAGRIDGADSFAVTDAHGRFVIHASDDITALDLHVEAKGFAPRNFAAISVGAPPRELKLAEGATIVGRVIADHKPAAAVNLLLTQSKAGPGAFVGAYLAATDASGNFRFTNVLPGEEFRLFGELASFGTVGAVPVQTVKAAQNGATTDIGEMVTVAAHALHGRVIVADGKTLPEDVRVVLQREQVADGLALTLDPDGRFAAQGLPAEVYRLRVDAPGYHLSAKNRSLDPRDPSALRGLVNQDISDMTVLLEPGQTKASQRGQAGRPGFRKPPRAERQSTDRSPEDLARMPLEGIPPGAKPK